jgi:hypothetical protein
MTDDRIVQRLEDQLSDAHATNADLRASGDVEHASVQPTPTSPLNRGGRCVANPHGS